MHLDAGKTAVVPIKHLGHIVRYRILARTPFDVVAENTQLRPFIGTWACLLVGQHTRDRSRTAQRSQRGTQHANHSDQPGEECQHQKNRW